MAMEFATGPEISNFPDTMFDWDNANCKLDDLNGLLDLEANIAASDLMRDIDMDLPMLSNSDLPTAELPMVDSPMADPWRDVSDSSDSGVECVSIKREPSSPAPSNSSDSSGDLSTALPMDLSCLPSDAVQLDSPTQYIIKTEPPSPPAGTIPGRSHTLVISTNGAGASRLNNVIGKTTSPVNHVLQSKVKIQPKPPGGVTCMSPKAGSTPASSKPLVLTAAEFACLTSQGVLKFQNPSNRAGAKTAASPTPAVTLGATSQIVDTDVKSVKRQQRMIKNRESASLSRKRKKEYMSSLEERLAACASENDKLRQENTTLKRKIGSLETENVKLRKVQGQVSMKKVAVCLMAVSFLLTLNLGSLSIFNTQQSAIGTPSTVPGSLVHHGRTLMSVNDKININAESSNYWSSEWDQSLKHIRRKGASSKNKMGDLDLVFLQQQDLGTDAPSPQVCPMYFNQSESQRLAKELTGWVMGHKQKEIKTEKKRKNQRRKVQQKKYQPLEKMKASMEDLRLGHSPTNIGDKPSPYEVQVFSGADRRYVDFMDALHRRNDTFYVVSFSGDHLLLPATAHNKTMRPRMSLVMPAVSLNETMQPPAGSIAMMQIDCEVMDTKLVHISQASIPTKAVPENVTAETVATSRKKWSPPQKRRQGAH